MRTPVGPRSDPVRRGEAQLRTAQGIITRKISQMNKGIPACPGRPEGPGPEQPSAPPPRAQGEERASEALLDGFTG